MPAKRNVRQAASKPTAKAATATRKTKPVGRRAAAAAKKATSVPTKQPGNRRVAVVSKASAVNAPQPNRRGGSGQSSAYESASPKEVEETGVNEDEPISSSGMKTPVEISDDDETLELLGSSSEIAMAGGFVATPSRSSGQTCLTDIPAPFLHHETRDVQQQQQQHEGDSRSREESPEGLTADSESKRSSIRWHHHFAHNPTATTQLLRDEDERERKGEARRAVTDPSVVTATEAEQGAVKQLFAQRQQSISYSPFSSRASSTGSSVTRIGITVADCTLPMVDEDVNNSTHTTATHGLRHTGTLQDASPSRGTRRSLSSSLDSAVLHSAPPVPPTADTPPPPLSLHGTSEPIPFYTAIERKSSSTHNNYNDNDPTHARTTSDLSLLGGPTKLSATHTWSSFSSAPLQLPFDHDGVCPSPQPKAEEVALVDPEHSQHHNNSNGNSAASTPNHPQQQQQQQQQPLRPCTPSSASGHLRMGGNVGRARSPSATNTSSTARLSCGWLMKVNAGVPAPSTATQSHPADCLLFSVPLLTTAGVFPTHPLISPSSSQQQQQQQQQHATRSTSLTEGVEGDRGCNNNSNSSGGGSPLRVRQREPPAWRSPQPSHFPKSLSVSPPSACSPPVNHISDATVVRQGSGDGSVPWRCRATTAAGAPAEARRERSQSNSSTSTAVLTQTFTQAAAAASSPGVHGNIGLAALARSIAPTAGGSCSSVAGSSGQREAPGRPSTQLITKAAATRPTASPATMWICLDDNDDDADENEGEEMRGNGTGVHHDAATVARGHGMTVNSQDRGDSQRGSTELDVTTAAPPQQQPQQRRPSEKSYPIADILSPTFRPRRRPAPQLPPLRWVGYDDKNVIGSAATATGAAGAAEGKSPRQFFIQLDDDSEAEEKLEEDSEAAPRKKLRVSTSPLSNSRSRAEERLAGAATVAPLPVTASIEALRRGSRSFAPLIIDDDDSDGDDAEEGNEMKSPPHPAEVSAERAQQEALSPAQTDPSTRVRASPRLSITLPSESDDSHVSSPAKPTVRDLFFPQRLDPEVRPCSPLYESIHAYQQHYQHHYHHHQQQQQQQDEDCNTNMTISGVLASNDDAKGESGRSTSAAVSPRGTGNDTRENLKTSPTAGVNTGDIAGHKRGRAPAGGGVKAAALVPSLPDWGRPADTLLRDFFPTRFTKKSFMEAAQKVMSPMHFLEPNDFWEAFASAEFVGEGSFGLVWRCRTVDGDLVAVKSCPILLRTKANIEDSFSTIREIATMRFLNEMQVPYILPLHSAFFVKAKEALPPLAQEALEWRQQQRKKAEAVVLEREVQMLGKGHAQLSKRAGTNARPHQRSGTTATTTAVAVAAAAAESSMTFEQRVSTELERQAANETREERATRARLQHIRLPRFLSITEDDLRQSDATVFLVMELCDGDVEGIPRSDGVAKGVAYCVSSALAAMHELGLLHLDLKPSNVLFAYEHGPSQATTPAHAAASPHSMDAVKFYLSDFGNCRLVGPDLLDEVAESYGTFEYMDLRALRDAVCGRPTDAFSLGATLYELLYGKRLYPKCMNPRCAAEDDHTRACFVEAARRTVVLPALPHTAAALSAGDEAPCGPDTERKLMPKKSRHGSHEEWSAGGRVESSSSSATALTPLQTLTLALLRTQWQERMTAAQCRRYLIDAYRITSTEEGGEDEEEIKGRAR